MAKQQASKSIQSKPKKSESKTLEKKLKKSGAMDLIKDPPKKSSQLQEKQKLQKKKPSTPKSLPPEYASGAKMVKLRRFDCEIVIEMIESEVTMVKPKRVQRSDLRVIDEQHRMYEQGTATLFLKGKGGTSERIQQIDAQDVEIIAKLFGFVEHLPEVPDDKDAD
jgi:hypothetical protein